MHGGNANNFWNSTCASSKLVERQYRSDADLIGACNHGSPTHAKAAFEELYRRHKEFVLRVALRILGDQDLALDVLQETFIYLLGRFPPTGTGIEENSKLSTFLYPVAKHNAISVLRKARRFPVAPEASLDALPGAEDRQGEDLRKLVAGLPVDQRETLLLRFVEDMTLNEIAQALDVPLGTVKSRLHHALAKLKASDILQVFRE